MSDELKQCPFCGSSNNISQSKGSISYIMCKGCEAKGPIFFKTEKENRPSWNTRPIEDALRAENARITKVCQDTSSQLWDACRENNRLEAENAKLKAKLKADWKDAYAAWEALK